ncbi:MAG TPA: thiamine phosphate synthase [Gemmataceae bacterium]|nr:thiamine phosphate synthase [Gemmataceae bacterium]
MTALDLTPAAARAVNAARALASHGQSPETEPVHLLRALLHEEEGLAMALLRRTGVSADALRRLFDLTTTPRPQDSAEPGAGFSAGTEAILKHAHEVAADFSGEGTVASDHLLLSLLRLDEALRQQLTAIGFSLARLEAEMSTTQAPALRLDEPLDLGETAEQMDTARILDASGNRAREALRVVEDYCRFSLDDPFLTGELKRLRHDLAETLAQLPTQRLIGARDTSGDVGTTLSTESEQHRRGGRAVAEANCKRLQESLRSMEEFGKIYGPEVGRAVEKLRYRSYTLEKAILLGADARQRLADARLYVLITGARCASGIEWTIEEAAAGGAQIFQLREKELCDRELLERARRVRRVTQKLGVLFIMNDRPDMARLADADGVHLGQDDVPVREARRILGADAIIGVSTHNIAQLRQAVLDGATYVGVGPTFPSATKDFTQFAGVEFVREAVRETSLPAFVIGGIQLNTLDAAVAAGARRVAVSDAICQADEPELVAAQMLQVLSQANPQ